MYGLQASLSTLWLAGLPGTRPCATERPRYARTSQQQWTGTATITSNTE